MSTSARFGLSEFAQVLIDRGANIHAVINNGYTPLLLAPDTPCVDLACLLVDRDAKVSMNDQETSLMLAALSGEVEMARFLLYRGADIHAVTSDGETALIRVA